MFLHPPDIVKEDIITLPVKIRRTGLSYAPSTIGSTRTYEAPIFNLGEVRIASEVDSFVKRAISKHTDVILKEGWYLDGDPDAIGYIKKRLSLMGFMTHKPWDILLQEICDNFVKYHNVFLIKGRLKKGEVLPGLRLMGVNGLTPISGYFQIPPPTVMVSRTRVGNDIKSWKQVIGYAPRTSTGVVTISTSGSTNEIEIKPANMVHFYKDREEGEIFGFPFILPSITDVKILREVEEHILNLIYLYSHPVMTWKVGTQDKPGSDAEMQVAEDRLKDGPISGVFVIPGNQDVEIKGASQRAIEAYSYLQYFKSRVFTGLGTSSSQMGEGDTTNRSAAASIGEEFFDRIRGYHRTLSSFINSLVIDELLLEGGYDIFDRSKKCWFGFNDPDVTTKIKKENAEVQKYTNYLTTETEARSAMGYHPMTDEMRADTFMERVKKVLAIIQAVDEPYGGSDSAKAAANKNKTQPSNQSGTQQAPKPRRGSTKASLDASEGTIVSEDKESSYVKKLRHVFELTRNDIIDMVADSFDPSRSKIELHRAGLIFQLSEDDIAGIMQKELLNLYSNGIENVAKDLNRTPISHEEIMRLFNDLVEMYTEDWKNFHKYIFTRLETNLTNVKTKEEAALSARAVFDSLQYLVGFKGKTHMYKSWNMGYAVMAYHFGETEVVIEHHSDCAKCNEIDKIKLTGNLLYIMSPFHYSCECNVKVVSRSSK